MWRSDSLGQCGVCRWRTNLALKMMHGIRNFCDRPLQGCRMGRRPPSVLHCRPRTPNDGWAPCGGTPPRWPPSQGAAPLLPTWLPPSRDGRLMRSCPMFFPGPRPRNDLGRIADLHAAAAAASYAIGSRPCAHEFWVQPWLL